MCHLWKEIDIDPYITPYTKVNSSWIIDLNDQQNDHWRVKKQSKEWEKVFSIFTCDENLVPKKYLNPEKYRQPNRKIGKAWTGTSQNKISKITKKKKKKIHDKVPLQLLVCHAVLRCTLQIQMRKIKTKLHNQSGETCI